MDPKYAIVAAGAVMFCYWIGTIHFQSDGLGFWTISNKVKEFPFTNFANAHGKAGQELWNSIQPAFKCPYAQLRRTGEYGKWTCGLTYFGSYCKQHPEYACVVYSFGVHSDSSFEEQILINTRCSVYAYDETVNEMNPPLKPFNPRLHFFKLGFGNTNTEKMRSLKTMMQENGGHEWIDILKMDIGEFEFDGFTRFFQDFDHLPIGQLIVNMQYLPENVTYVVSEKMIQFMRNLELQGLRMFSKEVSPSWPELCAEFSFINVKSLDRFVDV